MAARKAKLIGIEEAANLFGKSVHQMRQYKSKGLLKVADCIGNKDWITKSLRSKPSWRIF